MNAIVLSVNANDVNPELATGGMERVRRQLDLFLKGVERRALRMAEYATGNRDDALEIVQDSMLGFVRNYRDKPGTEWPPLFYRVLDSKILDFHRRHQVRSRWFGWLLRDSSHGEDADDGLEAIADGAEPGPYRRTADVETGQALHAAIRALPLRQRQCFLLRVWEGLDVAATATAMKCSEGSVKTHLSRALASLKLRLEMHHEQTPLD